MLLAMQTSFILCKRDGVRQFLNQAFASSPIIPTPSKIMVPGSGTEIPS